MPTSRVRASGDLRTVPFLVRSRFAWTFFGMGLFAGICLLFCGGYLVAQAIQEPLEASDTAVVLGGFTLSFASFLLIFLVWPKARSALRKRARAHCAPQPCAETADGHTHAAPNLRSNPQWPAGM